jgi:hypothetical protein
VCQWLLGTVDAHGVDERVGFAAPSNPERLMALRRSRPWIDV